VHVISLLLILAPAVQEDLAGARLQASIERLERFARGCEELEAERPGSARVHFEGALESAPEDPLAAFYLACCEARLGEREEALAWLERAVGWGYRDEVMLLWEPDLADLRAEPRFLQGLESVFSDLGASSSKGRSHSTGMTFRLRFPGLRPEHVSCHPLESKVAVTFQDGWIRVLDLGRGEVTSAWRADPKHRVFPGYSPGGGFIATADRDGSLVVWDPDAGQVVSRVGVEPFLTNWPFASFSADDSRLLVQGGRGVLELWDTSTWEKVAGLEGCAETRLATSWSLDGSRIAAVDEKGVGYVWDGETGECLHGPLRHPKPGNDVAFQPGGDLLAVTCRDGLIRVWDLSTRWIAKDIVQTYIFGDVHSLKATFSPSGDRLLSTSGAGFIRAWNSRTFAMEWEVNLGGGNSAPISVRYVADGALVHTRGNTARSWLLLDAETGTSVLDVHGEEFTRRSDISADGGRIVISDPEGVQVVDIESKTERLRWVHLGGKKDLVSTPQGYFRGDPAAAERAWIQIDGEKTPLVDLASRLYDPKRVRAIASGVDVKPASL